MATILVVDDESSVRFILKEVMEQDGHTILEACDGQQALDVFSKNAESVDLIITDLVMPEKNGLDLIMELKALCPTARILAISGGGGINGRFDYMPIAELLGAKSIMKKPFKVAELKAVVANLLSAT